MSAPQTYALCLRRRGNRNKGLPNFITQLGLTGVQQINLSASGMTVGVTSGIITVLGGAGNALGNADAAYLLNPTNASRPVQRILVGALPVHVANFSINTAALLDGDATWRLQKVLQTLNCPVEQEEPYVQQQTDMIAMLYTIRGITAINPVSSPAFTYQGALPAFTPVQNDRLYKAFFVNQLTGVTPNSGDSGMNGGKSSTRYEYFVTNKNPQL
jgi:hypothetical protein